MSGSRGGALDHISVPELCQNAKCYLCNTCPKTRLRPCDSPVFSLSVQLCRIRLSTRRRGASPGRPVRVDGSHRKVSEGKPGGFAGNDWGPSKVLRHPKSGTLP